MCHIAHGSSLRGLYCKLLRQAEIRAELRNFSVQPSALLLRSSQLPIYDFFLVFETACAKIAKEAGAQYGQVEPVTTAQRVIYAKTGASRVGAGVMELQT